MARFASAAAKNLKVARAVAKPKKKNLGHAVWKLAKTTLNPKNVATSVKKAVTGKGFTLPGSNYIGPLNEMKGQRTKSKGDEIAKKHDEDYMKMTNRGAKKSDMYLGYSHADRRALKSSWKEAKRGSGQALAVAAGMGAKALLNKTGLTKRFTKNIRKHE